MTTSRPDAVPGATSPSGFVRHPDRLFIGGTWIAPSTQSMIDVTNAATEEVLFQVAEAHDDDVRAAVAAARDAFDGGPWPHLTHAERATYLRAIGAGIKDRRDELGRLWTIETGILFSYSVPYMARLGALFDYYADLAETFEFIERHEPTGGGNVGLLVREPVGVVGTIVPWNGALPDLSAKVAPALLAGCTVVIKAPPDAPSEVYLFAEIVEEIGLPPGVVNVIAADRPASEMLVRDPGVDKISFTGSTATGRRIAAIMAERIGRYTLELGGKSAAVVMDDYDVKDVATSISGSAIRLTGQACSSLTRIIVTHDRHDQLVEALVDGLSRVRVGDPFDPDVDMGPLASYRQRQRVEHYVATGVAQGAHLALGGGRPADLPRGFYVEPTVFAHVDNAHTIAQEEVFGPVLCVIPAANEQDAIAIANDSIYGLNASVFTHDTDKAFAVARQLRTGTVGHNAPRTDVGIARGGFKQSGVGREGGTEGLLSFLEAKTVILDDEPTSLFPPAGDGYEGPR